MSMSDLIEDMLPFAMIFVMFVLYITLLLAIIYSLFSLGHFLWTH